MTLTPCTACTETLTDRLMMVICKILAFSPFEALISNFQSGVSLQGCLSLSLSRCSFCSSSYWFEWIHCLIVIPMSEERPRHVPFSSFILSEEVFIDDFYFYWCQENVFSLFVWIYRSLNVSKTEKELFFPPFDVLHVVHLVKHWTYIWNDFQVFVAFRCLWPNMLCSFSFFCKTSSVVQRAHQIPTVFSDCFSLLLVTDGAFKWTHSDRWT